MATATEISGTDSTMSIEPEKQSMMTMASLSENEALRSEVHHGEGSLELLGKVYHLARWGSASTTWLDDYSTILPRLKSPMKNTVLHLAALHGNDVMVDRVATQYPDLLFSVNNNDDTPLHVAARAGHVSTLGKLLDACDNFTVTRLLELMEMKNNQGNIMLHEAIMSRHPGMVTSIFHALEALNMTAKLHHFVEEACCMTTVEARPMEENAKEDRLVSWPQSCYELAWNTVNNKDQSVLCLAVKVRLRETVNQILEKCPANATPKGISPLEAAIMKRDIGMLTIIVSKKPEWIHLRDVDRPPPLHCAASIGFHEGVVYLLHKCKTCSIQRDRDGLLPLHLAAREGHLVVVMELLRHCLDPNEMLDLHHRNILHIAAKSGKLDVVRYVLQTPALEKMINQKDKSGDTPLHVATFGCRPMVVYTLTWDDRVNLNMVNLENQTALDLASRQLVKNISSRSFLPDQLIVTALVSAGAKGKLGNSKTAQEIEADLKQTAEFLWSVIDPLTLISTLIVTASVAACFSVPGEAQGTANNLHKAMFQFFTFCITVSFFSSTSATVILFSGRMGAVQWIGVTYKAAQPLV